MTTLPSFAYLLVCCVLISLHLECPQLHLDIVIYSHYILCSLFSYIQVKLMLFDWSRNLMEIRLLKRSFLAQEERSTGFVR